MKALIKREAMPNTNHSDHQDKGDLGILKGFKFSGYSYAVYESLSDGPQQL